IVERGASAGKDHLCFGGEVFGAVRYAATLALTHDRLAPGHRTVEFARTYLVRRPAERARRRKIEVQGLRVDHHLAGLRLDIVLEARAPFRAPVSQRAPPSTPEFGLRRSRPQWALPLRSCSARRVA